MGAISRSGKQTHIMIDNCRLVLAGLVTDPHTLQVFSFLFLFFFFHRPKQSHRVASLIKDFSLNTTVSAG